MYLSDFPVGISLSVDPDMEKAYTSRIIAFRQTVRCGSSPHC